MAKTAKTLWYCTSCGNESPKWMGRCPACGEWNTMVEAPAETRKVGRAATGTAHAASKPRRLNEIDSSENARLMLGMGELDRLLGGGIVPGSLVLIGGEPGIGKSTLSLQIPLHCKDIRTLYVSGEESARQVKMRAERLGGDEGNCYILCETRMEDILAEAESMQPGLMIVDSVQTMCTDSIESAPGSVSQIKEVAAQLLRFAKSSGVPVILIGHITKDGYIAGPKILEHIVDVVLQFEGDNRGAYRIMRSIKNRFGSTSELAVYEMTGSGLREVANPSEMLIPVHEAGLSGTAIAAMLDGNRSFLFEVQALVSSAVYGTAQRSATGYDIRRLNMQGRVPEHGRRHQGQRSGLRPCGGLRCAVVEFRLRDTFRCLLCRRGGPERRDTPRLADRQAHLRGRPSRLQPHLHLVIFQDRNSGERHRGSPRRRRAGAGEDAVQMMFCLLN